MSFNHHNKMYPPKYYSNYIILGFTIILAVNFIIKGKQFQPTKVFFNHTNEFISDPLTLLK